MSALISCMEHDFVTNKRVLLIKVKVKRIFQITSFSAHYLGLQTLIWRRHHVIGKLRTVSLKQVKVEETEPIRS